MAKSKDAKKRQSANHKGKYGAYLARATCAQCRVVFSSPKKRKVHVVSNHKVMDGANKNRAVKTYESIFSKIGG